MSVHSRPIRKKFGVGFSLLFFAALSTPALAINTSSEFANPFNKFMSPSGGVDLYSGSASFSHTLMELPARGDIKHDISLSYSSNVFLNARAKNDRAPSGWVGLGWRMGFGSIVCDHKSTKTHADDDFFWVSPNGVSKKILKKRNESGATTYHIEDEPYIGIAPKNISAEGVYGGWLVILANGTYLRYGDLDFGDNRSATRWTFSQGNYVGVVHSGTVSRYPYQWDLAQENNNGRDTSNFYYWQQTSQLKDNTSGTQWTSVQAYTQASYLNKISSTDGNLIEFILNNEAIDAAESKEYFIPYQSSAGVEDQGYFNVYERRFLTSIKVSKKSGATTNMVRQFDFKYQKINQSIPGSFMKRLLKTITENGADGKIQITRFGYLADFSKADENTYNYGALESAESPLGGRTEFKYSKMNIESGRISQGTLPAYQRYSADHHVNSDGNPYFVVQRITDLVGYITLYQWNGTKWVTQSDLIDRNFSGSELIVTTGKNHFHVTTKFSIEQSGYSEWAWDWNGKKWVASKAKIGGGATFSISGDNLIDAVGGRDNVYQVKQKVILADDYFVLIYTKRVQTVPTWRRYARVFCWNGQYWQAEGIENPINYDEVPSEEIVYAMPNYVILSVNNRVTVLRRESEWGPSWFQIGGNSYDPTPVWDANNPQLKITGSNLGKSNFRKIPFCGKDYFVLSLYDAANNSFNPGYLIFQWNGTHWVSNVNAWINSKASNAIARDDFCIVWGGSNESLSGLAPPLTVYSRDNLEWKIADYKENGVKRSFSTNFNDFDRYVQTSPDGKTIIIVHSERNTNDALYWPPYFVRMYQYNSATSCWDAVPLPTDASGTTMTQTGTDFGVVPYGGAAGTTTSKYGLDDGLATFVMKDHIAFASGRSRFILNWNGHQWQYDEPMSGERFTRADFTSDDAYDNFKVIALDGGEDFLVFRPQAGAWNENWNGILDSWKVWKGEWGRRPPNDEADFRMYDALFTYIHNGQQWVSKGRNDFGDPGYFKTGHIFGNFMITFGGLGFEKIWASFKYQDDFTSSTFYTYPVTTKVLDPRVSGSKKIATNFTYAALLAKIDASTGSAKFNKVSSVIPNNGKAATYFFNGMTSDQPGYTGNTDGYLLMDGHVYKNEIFNQANSIFEFKAVVSERKHYMADLGPTTPDFWPLGMVDRRLIKSVTDSLGVSKEILYSSFDAKNGMPKIVQETNSNGSKRFTKTTFAYEKYSGMGPTNVLGANMLTQASETTVYEKASGDNTPLSAADVRAAKATTWSPHVGNSVWMPNYTFAWNNAKGAYGEFVFPGASNPPVDPSASNPHWHRVNSAEKYSLSGDSVETKNANDVLATTFYRSDVRLPIGHIADAGFNECGVFTGDYDKGELVPGYFSYFDKENGWERSQATVVEAPANRLHYGEKVLRIENGEGAMKNFKIRANIEYEASSWVYVESGTGAGFFLSAEIRKGAAPADAWPHRWPALPPIVNIATSENLTTTGGVWKLLKVKIPAQSDPGSGNEIWVRLTIGRYGATFLAYVDDIRFHPTKALATTTYYDKKSRLPVLTVGADGNPGPRVAYDDFSRPKQWFNIDKTNPSNNKLMKAKEYHLINEVTTVGNVMVINPNGGETFKPGQDVWIEWMNKDVGTIAISYQNANGTGNQLIAEVAGQQGFGTYPWTIPAAAVGSRVIKVTNTTASQSDVSDAVFSVSTPPNTPASPNPADEATGIDWQTQLNLTWSGGDPDGDLTGYDIYFGEANPPTVKIGSATTGTFPITGLQRNKFYYWRVVAKDPVSSISGPVWTFRTNALPNSPPSFIGVSNSKQALQVPNAWRITLNWTGVDPDGDNIQLFRLKIFASANPDGSVCTQPHIPQFSGASGQPRDYTFDLTYANSLCQTWEWEAEAIDVAGATSGWKDMGSFIITSHPGQP
jgi:hypothetical protein